MSKWKIYRLGDILNFRRGHDLPKTNMVNGEIPVAGSNGIIGYHNVSTPIEPCITIGRSGNVGTPYIYNKCWAHNTVLYVDNFKGNDPLYLYYLLKTIPLASYGGGSAVPTLNRNHIHPIEIKHTPSLEEQRRIAGILGAIDDKIENNRRINDNLEQQAQALFDKFFFENLQKERKELVNYAEINPTRTITKNKEARCIEMANLPTKGSFPNDWIFKPYSGGMKFQNGDTIMARITPCLENGKTAYINFLDSNEIAFGSTEYIVLSAKEGFCPALFYFLARNKEFVDYAVSHMNGSSGRQRVGGADIANFLMPHISLKDSAEFAKIAMPIMDVIKNNSLENRKLSTLRDTLLPKLMSGELIL